MSCDDPRCWACTEPFEVIVERLNSALDADERRILMLEATLRAKPPSEDVAPLFSIAKSIIQDEAVFLRKKVKTYRAQLAEAVGARVAATAKKETER